MKKHLGPVLLVASLAVLVMGVAFASGSGAGKGAGKAMTYRYLVISPHTPEECLKALDEVSAEGTATLAKFDWGCKAGDHTGYAMITAKSDEEALSIVPESVRGQAKAIKLNKFSMADIKTAHASMMSEEKK